MPAPEGFVLVTDFLSPEEAAALLREAQALTFEHDVFRGQRLKRGYAQFGHTYVSTGRKLEAAAPMPACLRALVARAQPYLTEGTEFHQCIVTRYPPNAGIGWHTDAPRFGEWIMGVSLGGEPGFSFGPTEPRRSATSSGSSPVRCICSAVQRGGITSIRSRR